MSACSGWAATRQPGRGCTSSAARWCCPGRELLSGAVEVDETYVWERHTSVGGRSPGHKAIIVIAVEGDRAPERVRMRRIPNVKRDTLTEFVLDHVARGSEVRTDYLDEFTFRFNRRRARHRGLLFYRLLEGALAAAPQPYKELVSKSAA